MATGSIKTLDIVVRADKNFDRILTLNRQLPYAAAVALTKTVDVGRNLAIDQLKRKFKLRGSWYKKERKFGIKIKTASRDNLEASVYTLADWLEAHETEGGEEKQLSGKPGSAGFVPKHFAIPSDQSTQSGSLTHLPPKRTGTGAISRLVKPGRLIGKKRGGAFAIRVRGFLLLLQRMKKGAEPVLRYALPKRVRIKENRTITPSVVTVVFNRYAQIFDEALEKALATARISVPKGD